MLSSCWSLGGREGGEEGGKGGRKEGRGGGGREGGRNEAMREDEGGRKKRERFECGCVCFYLGGGKERRVGRRLLTVTHTHSLIEAFHSTAIET